MDQLTPAIRLFRQIVSEPKQLVDAVTLRKLRVWLSDDVGKVVDELSRRPTFREHAAWITHVLRNGSDSDERRIVDDLEDALRDVGKAYAKLLGNDRVLTQLHSRFPPVSHITSETVEVTGKGPPRVLERQAGLIDDSAMELSQLRHNCSQGSKGYALIKVDDYFEPRQEFVLGDDGRRVQSGALIVGLTPELHPVGNFILQSADRRLEQLLQLLTTIRRKVSTAIRDLGRTYAGQTVAEAAWDRLQNKVNSFRRTFQTGRENDLRNACIVLTQIYAAFHRAPDLDWLDLPEELIHEGRGLLHARIQGFRGGELFERVNGALLETQRLYEDRDQKLSPREEAIARGDLVLVAADRELYWEGKLTSFASGTLRKPWELLFPMVRKARNGGHVTEGDVFGEKTPALSGMPMRMLRLKSLLPSGLCKLIVPGPDPRTYRLDIDRQRIHLW